MKLLGARAGNLAVALAFLLFPLVLLLLAGFYWDYRPNVIMFPLMAGGVLIFCCIWLVVRSVLSHEDVLVKEGESIGKSDDPRASFFIRLLWMASVYPLCYVAGLLYGLIIFTLGYTSYHRLPVWQRLFSALLVFIIVYIGFYKLLGVSLPLNPVWIRD